METGNHDLVFQAEKFAMLDRGYDGDVSMSTLLIRVLLSKATFAVALSERCAPPH